MLLSSSFLNLKFPQRRRSDAAEEPPEVLELGLVVALNSLMAMKNPPVVGDLRYQSGHSPVPFIATLHSEEIGQTSTFLHDT